jgi:ADP-heptose:LPS heptosyltransferase
VLVGAPDEVELCNSIAGQVAAHGDKRQECAGKSQTAGLTHPTIVNLAGQTKLPELVALMSLAGVVVCSESSANFIARAVGRPFITLMGPTRPDRTGPYGGKGRVISADLPCLGCLRRRCPHASCMQLIDPARVTQAVLKMMNK